MAAGALLKNILSIEEWMAVTTLTSVSVVDFEWVNVCQELFLL